MRKLYKSLFAVATAERWGLETRQLAELVKAADRAFEAGKREANGGRFADPERDTFERLALSHGFETTWPGLWPLLRKDGRDFHLPETLE